jgi:hypothetical protein
MTSARHLETVSEPIHRITPREIERGELLGSLLKGAAAVVLSGDERVHGLFQSVLDWLGLWDPGRREFFGADLLDLARNHLEDNANAGDMLRFQPGVFGHLARKFFVFRNRADESPRAFPDAFYLNNRRISVPHKILDAAWNLTSQVLMNAMPRHVDKLAYAAEVDVLAYPIARADVIRLAALLADSSGTWSRLGHRIDANKGKAAGMFDKKIAREIFAMASLVPGLRKLAMMLNDKMALDGKGSSSPNHYVVGGPHIDRGKYVTGLIGSRQNLQTQIFSAGRWIPLPVTPDGLSIFPGLLAGSLDGPRPTRHRILLEKPGESETESARNITLSLSIVERPKEVGALPGSPA